MGPDGKLYFSIGDRGLNVDDAATAGSSSTPTAAPSSAATPTARTWRSFATGLRNPQELAFDEYGNLFTGDNNSDGGDKARWVYVVEGGDSGWRIGYQCIDMPSSRGPWNAEKLWDSQSDHPRGLHRAADRTSHRRPVGADLHRRRRPAGRVAQTTSSSCDFRGGPADSGIRALQNKPKGAAFELVEPKSSSGRSLATDVRFRPRRRRLRQRLGRRLGPDRARAASTASIDPIGQGTASSPETKRIIG